jgi:hypothetical protein
MKDYRKKSCGCYLFLLISSVLLAILMCLVFFKTGNISFPAVSGFIGVVSVTLSLHRSLLYISLTTDFIIIKGTKKKNINYSISEINSIQLEHTLMNGCRIGIKRGYIIDVYDLLLVGKHEIKTLKEDLKKYGVNVICS